MSKRVVITGAFSYTGAAVARELLRRGYAVHTLTNRRRPASASEISCAPLRFDPDHLQRELAGADAFVNTYWVRLPFQGQSFATAVQSSRLLIDAAARAGIKRLVHVSVSNPDSGKNLGYYAGKAQVEDGVRRCGLPHAIVRPTLVVGPGDVLSNNIAWFLRRFPLFPVPDGGRYRIQPVTLDDTARIIADALESGGNLVIDAAGPDVMTFAEYVRALADACGIRRWLVPAPGWAALGLLHVIGPLLRDVVLTREELMGLEQELLVSSAPPLGKESVVGWLRAHGHELGRRYVNDLDRHFRGGRLEPLQR